MLDGNEVSGFNGNVVTVALLNNLGSGDSLGGVLTVTVTNGVASVLRREFEQSRQRLHPSVVTSEHRPTAATSSAISVMPEARHATVGDEQSPNDRHGRQRIRTSSHGRRCSGRERSHRIHR